MTEELILSGADVVKVGIGPGSVCTTRKMAGVGYPQLSAVIECADAAHGLGGLIIAVRNLFSRWAARLLLYLVTQDGGCTCPGDVSKAFGGGADFVMLGGMLAGHDESGGELMDVDGRKFKKFYGMSSATAMTKYAGGVAEYRASEGKTVMVSFVLKRHVEHCSRCRTAAQLLLLCKMCWAACVQLAPMWVHIRLRSYRSARPLFGSLTCPAIVSYSFTSALRNKSTRFLMERKPKKALVRF